MQRAFKIRLTLSGQILLTLAIAGFFVFGGVFGARPVLADSAPDNLWHFNECSGASTAPFLGSENLNLGESVWSVGKWNCSMELLWSYAPLNVNFNDPLLAGDLTVSAWFRFPYENSRLSFRLVGADGKAAKLSIDQYYTDAENLTGSFLRLPPVWTADNDWHQAVFSVNSSEGRWRIYLDGSEAISSSLEDYDFSQFSRLEIGTNNNYTLVDEVAVWRRTLSGAEINETYVLNRETPPAAPIIPAAEKEMIHLWQFDEGEGSAIHDAAGNADLPQNAAFSEGKWGSGLLQSWPADQRIDANFNEPINARDLSLELWFKNSSHPNEGRGSIYLSGSVGNFGIRPSPSALTVYTPYGNKYFGARPELADDNWHYFALVFNSHDYRYDFYIDGQNIHSEESLPLANPAFNQIHIRGDNYPYSIDELAVFQGALSSDEIAQHYASGQPRKKSALDPVIIVPGIMGSYLVRENTYEEIWPRISTMLIDPWDGYLNELAMGMDGMPNPESGNLQPADIFRNLYGEDFFAGLINELTASGYEEGVNLFVFPYDWRLDLNIIAGDDSRLPRTETLKEKVEAVISQTGAEKVDIVAHSMGGLIAKLYMQKYGGDKVNKFVDIATPHLGAPETMKTLMYGDNLDIWFLNSNKIYNISQNLPSIYQLLPSQNYFDDSDPNYAYYIYDMFDSDNNGVKGRLDYGQSIEFQANSGRNINLLALDDQLHQEIDSFNSESLGIKTYNMVGCGRPTIGQIYILNKEKSGGYEYGLKYVNGDGTVPLRSAEYLSATNVYYNTGAAHAGLPSFGGVKQLVTSILHGEEDNFEFSQHANIRTDASNCALNGTQISFHSPIDLHVYDDNDNHVGSNESGDIEINITGAAYDEIEGNKFVFLPAGKAYRIIGEAEEVGSFNARVEKVQAGNYTETVYYNEIPLNSALVETRISINDSGIANNLELDEEGDGIYETIINPDSILNEEERVDLVRPVTNISPAGTVGKDGYFISEVQIELAAEDDNSGVLKTEYSLDDSQNWIEYQEQFLLAEDGEYKIIYYSIDRAGNREEEKNEVIKIDKTKPEVLLSIPGEISHDQKLNILYNASDNYSGIASDTIAVYLDDKLLTANAIDLFYQKTGEHALKITAEDMAGNIGSSTVKFKIIATPDSVISDIQRLYDLRWITDRTISKILIREIEDIKWHLNRLNEAKDRIIKNIARIEASNQSAKMKTKLIQRYNEELLRLDRENNKKLNFVYDRIERSLGKYLKRNLINREAYDIIKDNVNYLRDNL